jgi:hypothetical protein
MGAMKKLLCAIARGNGIVCDQKDFVCVAHDVFA